MANFNVKIITVDEIKNNIITVRNEIVLLDSDLADLYEVETKTLNRAVKRNIERFPEEFRFQLTEIEWQDIKNQFANNHSLRYQIDTLNDNNHRGTRRGQHRKYLPYVFTEQGVAMLSAVLRSEIAVQTSIQIINAFVSMRRFLSDNAEIFRRLDSLELNQISTNEKINTIFHEIDNKLLLPNYGIFYDGQMFDAWKFISDLVRSAKESIILIDNY
jgi:phage regulator Rha-like protein